MGEIRNIGSKPRSDIICLEGNGYRPSHFGDGYIVGEAMYTLNSTEVHAVCYEIYDARGNGGGQVSPTIVGGHQATISDYTAIVVEYEREDNANGEKVLQVGRG